MPTMQGFTRHYGIGFGERPGWEDWAVPAESVSVRPVSLKNEWTSRSCH